MFHCEDQMIHGIAIRELLVGILQQLRALRISIQDGMPVGLSDYRTPLNPQNCSIINSLSLIDTPAKHAKPPNGLMLHCEDQMSHVIAIRQLLVGSLQQLRAHRISIQDGIPAGSFMEREMAGGFGVLRSETRCPLLLVICPLQAQHSPD